MPGKNSQDDAREELARVLTDWEKPTLRQRLLETRQQRRRRTATGCDRADGLGGSTKSRELNGPDVKGMVQTSVPR